MACSHRKRAIAALLLATAACAAMAQDRSRLPITVEARSSDFDYKNSVLVFEDVTIVQGPIRITAEKAKATGLDFEDSGWEFSGAVRITLTDGALASDTARVRFAKGEIESATVTGSPATFEQRRNEQLSQGHGNRIDYDLHRGTVDLAGDAWISDGRNEISGATLVYSTTSQRVISNKPVVITIKPGEAPVVGPTVSPAVAPTVTPAVTPPEEPKKPE